MKTITQEGAKCMIRDCADTFGKSREVAQLLVEDGLRREGIAIQEEVPAILANFIRDPGGLARAAEESGR